jgi:phosphomethylpyrimidine synthase
MSGADFICYVTPSEHLSLPEIEDVKQGVIASRIAAHAADIARKCPGAREWDDTMGQARKNLDWETMYNLSIDPEHARKVRSEHFPKNGELCTMCGEYCAMKKIGNVLGVTRKTTWTNHR